MALSDHPKTPSSLANENPENSRQSLEHPCMDEREPPTGKNISFSGLVLVTLLLVMLGWGVYTLLETHGTGERTPLSAAIDWVSNAISGGSPSPASEPRETHPIATPISLAQKNVEAAKQLNQSDESGTEDAITSNPPANPPKAEPSHIKIDRAKVAAKPRVAPVTEKPKPTVWPSVEVTAALGRGEQGGVVLNGLLLTVGEENIDGVKLIGIEPQAAILSYKGQERRVAVKKAN